MSLAVDPDAAAVGSTSRRTLRADRRFAAAGFADQSERFAVAEREADAVHRMHGADLAAKHAAAHRDNA